MNSTRQKSLLILFSLFICQGIYAMEVVEMQPDEDNQVVIVIDRRDGAGNTQLHQAAKANQLEVVQSLLAAQADPNAVNNNGERPSDCAKPSWWEWLVCKANVGVAIQGMPNLTSNDAREIIRCSTKGEIYNLLKRHEAPPSSWVSWLYRFIVGDLYVSRN